MTAIKAAWAFVTGSRDYALALAALAVALALYAWGATAARDRDALAAWSNATCLAAGSPAELGDAGKLDKDAAAKTCRRVVADLVAFRRDSQAATSAALAKADSDRAAKAAADITTASNQAAARQVAGRKMETENEKLENDRVGPDWFDALNRLGGLLPEGE